MSRDFSLREISFTWEGSSLGRDRDLLMMGDIIHARGTYWRRQIPLMREGPIDGGRSHSCERDLLTEGDPIHARETYWRRQIPFIGKVSIDGGDPIHGKGIYWWCGERGLFGWGEILIWEMYLLFAGDPNHGIRIHWWWDIPFIGQGTIHGDESIHPKDPIHWPGSERIPLLRQGSTHREWYRSSAHLAWIKIFFICILYV
jgi:hypothetical protein